MNPIFDFEPENDRKNTTRIKQVKKEEKKEPSNKNANIYQNIDIYKSISSNKSLFQFQ